MDNNDQEFAMFDGFAERLIDRHATIMTTINNDINRFIEKKRRDYRCPIDEGNVHLWDVNFSENGRVTMYSRPITYPRSAEIYVDEFGQIYVIKFMFDIGRTYFSEPEALYRLTGNIITHRQHLTIEDDVNVEESVYDDVEIIIEPMMDVEVYVKV